MSSPQITPAQPPRPPHSQPNDASPLTPQKLPASLIYESTTPTASSLLSKIRDKINHRPVDATTEPMDLDSNESSESITHSDETSAESEDSQQSDDDDEWDFGDAWDDSNTESVLKPQQQEVDGSNLELLLFQQQVLSIKSKKPAPPLLPFEILVEISKYLPSLKDHKSFMMVSQRHLSALFPRLYKTPAITSPTTLSLFIRTVKESVYYETRHYMNSVKCLHLGDLSISDDHLFDIINRCNRLESLSVHTPTVTSTSLCHVSNALPNLENLDMSGCGGVEMGIWVMNLGSTTCLPSAEFTMTSLNLSRTKISDAHVPQLLDHLPQLRNLSLTACARLTNSTACHIAIHNQGLVSLVLDECHISDEGVTALCCGVYSKLHGSLRMLRLNRTAISVAGFQTVLCSLPKLESFAAVRCALMHNSSLPQEWRESDPEWLGRATMEVRQELLLRTPAYPGIQFRQTRVRVSRGETIALESISVSGAAVLDSELDALKGARGLRRVRLVGCRVTQGFVVRLVSRLDKLETICIEPCGDVSIKSIIFHIARSPCRFTLEHLTATNERVPLRDIFRLVQTCPRLKSVSVSHMNRSRKSFQEAELLAMRKFGVVSDAVEEDALEGYLQGWEWRF
ncbi:SCF ubiquitin ligase complex subunit [Podochytrium sp. JEL0797]|nr:SCF ubiquitin ligase complex subunit [Podochytrium sp. JEL0797]